MAFHSILSPRPDAATDAESLVAPEYFADLNLNQIVAAVTANKQEYNLPPFFYLPLLDRDVIMYRQQVMQELETTELYATVTAFAAKMRKLREQLAQAEKLRFPYQQQSWLLDAMLTYCDAVTAMAAALQNMALQSQGWTEWRDYLAEYSKTQAFLAMVSEINRCRQDLAGVAYCLHIRDNRIRVCKYNGEADFCRQVEDVFDKFKQDAVKNYRVGIYDAQQMNQVEENVLEYVVQQFPVVFADLAACCEKQWDFLAPAIARFDREVQFYIAWLESISQFKQAGLKFCYPQISSESKETVCHNGFDLALARQLVANKQTVVCNDFYLTGPERIFVVSGPNQGGKTTFARTFGQLHHLARLGCCVPGSEVRLFLVDRIFTHFEKEEKVENLRGKLQDDLLRIRRILDSASSDSLIIMNEIFTSTTLKDAIFLGTKVMQRIIDKDLLCVCVTFVEELATLSEKTVSMVSTIVPEKPELRTFKIIRESVGGKAHAMSLAEKHRVTYEWLKERIQA